MKITIQASIVAEHTKVWEYYTNPEHIIKWNFASPEWRCPQASNNMRIGGKYQARMEAKDGSYGFDFEAEYTKIIPGKEFAYVMPDKREVSIKFRKIGDNTEIVIIFDADGDQPVTVQRDGWQAILNNFKKYVENN